MQQFNKWKKTRGFLVAAERGRSFRHMITQTAIKYTEILAFWKRHGLMATKEAFNVSRPTLFRW